MELSNMQGLFEKLGLKQESLTSGKFKDAGSPFKPMTAEERKYLQGLVMDLHGQFVADVAAARKMDVSEVETLADGRAMTGKQALEVGLVDKLGGLEESVDLLKSMCGVKGKIAVVEGPETKKSLFWELLGLFDLTPDSHNSPWQLQY
ncbi:MAG: S49 family peptidase, partial [Thermodesulfobacteriota bacterium]|nr:S49 family peptidase [Thermodesulfobacteriota bacterium]